MLASRESDLTRAQRAHVKRILWLLLAYAVILPPLIWLRSHRHVSDLVMIVMAIAASVPVLGIFASWGRYISDERDEYQQAVMLRRIAVSTNATMAAAVAWGFLQAFGVVPLIETYWVAFVWVVIQGAFGCVAIFSRNGEE